MSYAKGGPFKCSYCPQQPRRDRKDWQLEGPRFKEISLGADNGCSWCTIFRQGIQEFSPLSDLEPNAVFQWSGMLLEAYAEARLSLHLEFFCDKNDLDIIEGLGKALPVPTSTGSAESYSWVSEQFKICVNSHNPCRILDTSFQPSRLLDVEGSSCESRVRLIDSREKRLPRGTEYACLSHCWGSSNVKCITTQNTLEQNKQGIPWNLMPRTFQEAIKFICKMGIRYLWIDSLCIIQDDQDDWRKEAATMCEIYSNSTLTLAASASTDSNQGLFRVIDPRHEAHELFMALPGRNSVRILTRVPLPHFPGVRTKFMGIEDDAPLLRRGWAFQERLLSPRVLHFAANELVWECMEGIDCQCHSHTFSTGIKSSLSSTLRVRPGGSDNRPELAAMEWLNIVKHYGALSLTFREDKLTAISGAAKRTRQFNDGDEYVAGFWKEDLPHGLAWICDEAAQNTRPTTWTAPTWSWACLDSRISFIHLGQPPDRIYATVNQTECFAAGPDPTGQIVYAQMIISGPAADVELNYNEPVVRDSPATRCQYKFKIFFGSEPVGRLWPDYAFGAESEGRLASGSALICLLVYEYNRGSGKTRCCLVLTKSGTELDVYERVGCLMLFKEEDYSRFCERSSERIYTIV